MIGWILFLYGIVGIIASLIWGYISVKRILSKYDRDVFEKALEHITNNAFAEQSSASLIKFIVSFMLWPYYLVAQMPIAEELLTSECEFISKLHSKDEEL